MGNLGSRARSFFNAYRWVLSDFAQHAGIALSHVIFLAACFILCRIFVFSIVIHAVRSIDYAFLSGERNLEVYAGLSLNLFQASLFSWLLIVLTATAGYLFYRSVFTSTYDHMYGVFSRILYRLNERPVLGQRVPMGLNSHGNALVQTTTHVRLVNILSRILLFSVLESISVLICLAVLLCLHTPTTLVLLTVGVLFMPIYYALGLEGIRNRRNLKPANRDLAEALLEFETSMATPNGTSGTRTNVDAVTQLSTDSRVASAFRVFQVQRLVVFKSEYAGWFLLASVAVICVFWIHYLSLKSLRISDWYFGVFLVMMYSLMRSLRSIVSSGRFLDSAMFCRNILETPVAPTTAGPLPNELALTFTPNPSTAEDIGPGDVVLIETLQPNNMFALRIGAGFFQALRRPPPQIEMLPMDACQEDIHQTTQKGCLPAFIVQAVPEPASISGCLSALKDSAPIFIVVRGRLGASALELQPKAILTLSGTTLVRHWTPGQGIPFTPFRQKARADDVNDSLDDDLS